MKTRIFAMLLAGLMLMVVCAGAIGEADETYEARKPYTVGNISITVPVEWDETDVVVDEIGGMYRFSFAETGAEDGEASFAIIPLDDLLTGRGSVVKNGTIEEILEQLTADAPGGDEVSAVNMGEVQGYEVWRVQSVREETCTSVRMFKVGDFIAMMGVHLQSMDTERVEALAEEMLQSMTIVDEK